jgi:hypothetical protein
MAQIVAKCAWILSLAVTLFFLGPQLGSLDVDGDGVPDVPVMVMHGNNDQNVQATQCDRQARIVFAIAALFTQLTCRDLGLMKLRVSADLRTEGLHSITPLRC